MFYSLKIDFKMFVCLFFSQFYRFLDNLVFFMSDTDFVERLNLINLRK